MWAGVWRVLHSFPPRRSLRPRKPYDFVTYFLIFPFLTYIVICSILFLALRDQIIQNSLFQFRHFHILNFEIQIFEHRMFVLSHFNFFLRDIHSHVIEFAATLVRALSP